MTTTTRAPRGTYTERVTVREEAHRLLDAVPEDQLPAAVEILRHWAATEHDEHPRRQFRTTAIFDGEEDLGFRAKEIVRNAWNTEEHHSA